MDRAFGGYHPLVNFIFFIAAVVFGMFFVHPAFVTASAVLAAVYYFALKGRKGVRFAAAMLLFAVLLTLINPVFNTQGDTVLFTYFGRSYTLEALLYGAATGGMFFSVIMWFSCYNDIMTSDKFIFLFGRLIPAISLVLTMVLRLVPDFKNRTAVIAGARRCVGKGGDGDKKQKLKNSMDIVSVLTSWALEGAVVTADSMRSRGYGASGRTSFAIYRFSSRDAAALAVMAVTSAAVIVCAAFGGTAVTYIPSIDISPFSGVTAAGAAAYAALLAMPSAIHFWEAASWRILRSRI